MSEPNIHDIQALRLQVERLQARWKKQRDDETAGATAEGHFRLALHPHVMAAEAVRHLHAAHRIDGTNPRYAYHLARLFFLHGDLDAASRWLREAVNRCPTSHRLWAHVCILQRELNDRYKANAEYDPDYLRRLADATSTGIRNGNDEFGPGSLCFVPPKSQAKREAEARQSGHSLPSADGPAVAAVSSATTHQPATGPVPVAVARLLDAGKCRWSGVLDLEIEHLLEQEPSVRARDRILPKLEQVAALSRTRSAGSTGFVILAVQWLLSGYPVTTIRRLMSGQPCGPDDHAQILLDLVCQLFETPRAELPARLAAALAAGELPPLLVALVHHRRLLWRRLEYPALGTYRSALRMTARMREKEDDPELEKEAAESIRKLVDAARQLDRPPPDEMDDAQPQAVAAPKATVSAAVSRLCELEKLCRSLVRCQQQGFDFLKQDLEPRVRQVLDAATGPQVKRDVAGCQELLHALAAAGEAGAMQLTLLVEQTAGFEAKALDDQLKAQGDLASVFCTRLEECRKAYHELKLPKGFSKVLTRLDDFVQKAELAAVVPVADPALRLQELLQQVREHAPQAIAPAAGGATPCHESLDDLCREAEETRQKLEEYWNRLVCLATRKQGDLLAEQVRQGLEIREYVGRCPARLDQVLARTAELRAELPVGLRSRLLAERTADTPANVLARLIDKESVKILAKIDQVDTAFREFANTGRFRKKLGPLTLPDADRNPDAAAPIPASSSAASPPVSADGLAGVTGLEQAVAMVDQEMERLAALDLATFDGYSASQKLAPEILMLHLGVLNQVAETRHRLGQHWPARDLWRRGLVLDPLCLPILKNIAVSDTLAAGDHARILQSWKAYCEVLYFHAIAGGNPRLSARLRSEFHALYASAFTHGYIQEDRESASRDDDRGRKFVRLLNHPGCLREYVQHRCAELLNRRFEIHTPTLFLGASRTAKPETREKMRDALAAFVRAVCATLPDRVRKGYEKACLAELDRAAEECRKPEGLILANNPKYAEDEQKLIHWTASVYRLKEQFFFGFVCMPDPGSKEKKRLEWEKQVHNLDFLQILDGLAVVPLGLSDDLKEAAVSAMAKPYGTSPGALVGKLDGFLAAAGGLVAVHAFQNPQDRLLDVLLLSFLERKQWWQRQLGNMPEEIGKVFEAMDNGGFLFPEELKAIFKKQNWEAADAERAVALLQPLHGRCLALAGLALHLAGILAKLKRETQAIAVLDAAIANGMYPPGVEECRQLKGKISGAADLSASLEKNDFSGAVNSVLAELKQAPQDLSRIDSLLGIYQKWFKEKSAELTAQAGAVERQLAEVIGQAFPDESARAGEAAADYRRLLKSKRELVAAVALGPAGDLSNAKERERAIPRLEQIDALDLDNGKVTFLLAVAWFKAGMDKFRGGQGDRGRAEFVKADELAERVLQGEAEAGTQAQARQIREQTDKLLAAL